MSDNSGWCPGKREAGQYILAIVSVTSYQRDAEPLSQQRSPQHLLCLFLLQRT